MRNVYVRYSATVLAHLTSFLGAFAKLRNATFSFLVSVYTSVLMEHLGSYWTEFHEV